MFQFKLSYVAFAAALTSTFVYADPNSYTHLSGAKVIDIEAPNAAGVSHNVYREFNVDSRGAILNNSGSDVAHATHGNIAKNNNLTNGGASVILNEVISNKASSLNGFIEVNGQKADVVIANPNGITCSGCSFINTNKAVLTTGKANLTDTGAIGSYTVTGGTLAVNGAGMDASNSYAVLLADAIKINAKVTAANALISAGNFTLNNQTGAVTSAGKKASLFEMLIPEYSIDISSLGGVRANSITMLGTNVGFGVRNKGAIVANTSLNMTSNGNLINEGSVSSQGMMTQFVSLSDIKNTGTISTNNTTLLNSQKNIYNDGSIASSAQLIVGAAGNIENSGSIKSTRALAVSANGNLKTNYASEMLSDNLLTINVLKNVDHSGAIRAQNTTVNYGGESFQMTGNIIGRSNLLIQSVKDNALGSGQLYNAGQMYGDNISIATKGDIQQSLTGRVEAANALALQAGKLTNEGNVNGNVINIDTNYAYNAGTITGEDINVKAKEGVTNYGTLTATNNMLLDMENTGKLSNYASIKAGNQLTINAKTVNNGGYKCGLFNMSTCGKGTLSADKLVLNSSHNYASEMGGNQKFKNSEINTIK